MTLLNFRFATIQQIFMIAAIILRTLIFRNAIPLLLITVITPLLLISFSWSLHASSISAFIALAVLLPALGVAFGILPHLVAEQRQQREFHFWLMHPIQRETILIGYVIGSIIPMFAGAIVNIWYVDSLMHLTFHNWPTLAGIMAGTIAAWIVLATIGVFLGLIVPHPREAVTIGVFVGLVLGVDLVITSPAHTQNLWLIIAPYLPTSLCEQIIRSLYGAYLDKIALVRGSLGIVLYGAASFWLTVQTLPQRQSIPVAISVAIPANNTEPAKTATP